MSDKPNRVMSLWSDFRSYMDLNIEYAKLTAAEKTTVLLTAVATAAVIGVMAMIVLFFLSLAIVHWLAMTMSLAMAYLIMTVFNLLLLVIVFVMRKPLIVTPISKFVTRVILR